MMQKLQRFGGAMFIPVMIMPAMGLLLGLSNTLLNEQMVGSIAAKGTIWYAFWKLIFDGSYVVFQNIPLLFVIGLPIGLAKKSKSRAALEAFVIYMFFNVFINSLLSTSGSTFGVDFSKDVGGYSGLASIAGIKTLDTSMVGALIIAGITIWLHERFYDKKLPDLLAIFQGSALVTIVGFLVMIPVALLTCLVWPHIQEWIFSLQGLLKTSGAIGVGLYSFLERILIPTGLHHFIWQPFAYGPAAVNGGLLAYWFSHVAEFANSTKSMTELFPQGGFTLFGNSKVFGCLGIAIALIITSRPEKRKQTIGLILPVAFTAVITGITEPIEFTFLFIAPYLFLIHAILAGLMTAIMYAFGVSGNFIYGLLDFSITWASTWQNHWATWLLQIGIGLGFTVIYVVLFRYLIIKFNILTPGRESDDVESKLFTKADYKEKKLGNTGGSSSFEQLAEYFLADLGGAANIQDITNCATRLRVTVKDPEKLESEQVFRKHGAHGLVRNKQAIQVIVGLSVGQVRDKIEEKIKSVR
ncbi:alpha-glucoside-specific PTS transporter subunit IIBC [Neobacillus sp. OS1-33]|uniref:alpha-glucoside-specific PTS transporter subunit IIBC n=1 Tax=Neobacillus TaxID=2675232 RepID=UPI0027E0B3A4|nr:alpha-glucoside-specific PTS transporter subunit IIBC [Neobacillus sp. OS1-33]WML26415.1 alpha-glucoside-specific PTS transporter subunit IIBC [Neobacillus sp. OS1-33]